MTGRCVFAAALMLSAYHAAAQAAETSLYVAADGDNANPGTRDAPFACLEAARDAIRLARQSGTITGPVTVFARGGIYRRERTFDLNETDSGTAESPVTHRACPGEEVHLVGGIAIDKDWFESVKDDAVKARLPETIRGILRQVDLREHGIADFGEFGGLTGGIEFFHNGERLQLARWPNEGWAEARSAKTIGMDEQEAERLAKEGQLGNVLTFRYTGDGPRQWQTLEGVWIRGIWQQEYWFESWNPEAFDPAAHEITMAFNAYPNLRDWRRFYVANVLEELDRPGEWYLNRESGVLYLLPPDDSDSGRLYASMIEDTMVALNGTSYVTFRGFIMEAMRGQAVSISGGSHNLIAGCTIRNARQGGTVSGGTDNGVVSCDFYDLAAMGINLSGGDRRTLTPAGNHVVNCHIHHYAEYLKNWQPAVKVSGVGNRVTHCLIHHAPQYAINYEGNDHVFEFNEMHDLCLEMSDVGVLGCGTDWTYRGNVVRYNFIHHIPERPYPGVVGVYFDNCASSAEVFGNVFYKMTKPVMIGGGRDHIVTNNIFIECAEPVYMDNRGLRWEHFKQGGPMYKLLDAVNHDAPPWSERYPELARILNEMPQAPLGNVLERNVSVRSGWRNPEEVCRATFANNIDRQYMRVEDNYVTDDDPGFVDPEHTDFTLRGDSVVYERIPGFQRIPFEKIGLYKDEYRRGLP